MKKAAITITIDRDAIRKRLPSELMKAAMYRSGAGIHADQGGRYNKRSRSANRREERQAMRGHYLNDFCE